MRVMVHGVHVQVQSQDACDGMYALYFAVAP